MMNSLTSIVLLLSSFGLISALPVPDYIARHRARSTLGSNLVLSNGDVKPNSYVVKLTDTANHTAHVEWANALVANSSLSNAECQWYSTAFFNGYTADLDDDTISKVLARQDVAWVEEDAIVSTQQAQITGHPWGLQRISSPSALPANSNVNALTFDYSTGNATGQGVDVYVLDSGVLATHEQFNGRAVNAFAAPGLNTTDDNGHGSHVAGIVGGETFGVAPQANLLAVKVIDSQGVGPLSNILAGMNFTFNSAKASTNPSVMSMSLGTSGSAALDNAAASLVQAGITLVVAAGNSGQDASTTSPARANGVITVGAMDITDTVASFSNFGTDVDVFAPGVNVISCGIDSNNATRSLSGTSMATPHISGIVALLLSQNPQLTPTSISGLIKGFALRNALSEVPANTTNLLAQNQLTLSPVS